MPDLSKFTKYAFLDLLSSTEQHFDKNLIRAGDISTTIYFFSTDNSCNCTINIHNDLLASYEIDLGKILTKSNNS